MKGTKKLVSILLILSMLFGTAVVSFAAEETEAQQETAVVEVAEEETTRLTLIQRIKAKKAAKKAAKEAAAAETAENSENSGDAEETAEETEKTTKKSLFNKEIVANLYLIVSDPNPKMPHVWIYIENLTDRTFTVGHYTLGPHATMSCGCWKDRGNGDGVYYNLERYWVKDETYDRSVAIKSECTEKQLNRVSKTINKHNYWNWVFNCAWFGACVWNSCDWRLVTYLFSPKILRLQMKVRGGKALNVTIQKNSNASECYKHTSDGLEVVYSGVLYTTTGV